MFSKDPTDPGILRLSYRHAAIAVEIRALALSLRLKAGFRTDQPRVAAGNPDGSELEATITALRVCRRLD